MNVFLDLFFIPSICHNTFNSHLIELYSSEIKNKLENKLIVV